MAFKLIPDLEPGFEKVNMFQCLPSFETFNSMGGQAYCLFTYTLRLDQIEITAQCAEST